MTFDELCARAVAAAGPRVLSDTAEAGGVGSPSGPFALRPEGPQGVEGD